MHKKILALALALGAAAAHAGERLFVQVPAVLDPTAPINEAVRTECRVDALVGQHVFAQVAQRWPDTQSAGTPAEAGTDPLLRLTLVSVMGVGGGAWSGRKSMTLRVDLTRQGKTLQSTVLTRASSGGVMGGMSGTCPIMERIAVALGRDVAGWLPRVASSHPASPGPAMEEGPASAAPQ